MKHKLLSLFFVTIVAMNMFATDVWDGSSDIFTHGAGTESSPYLIENAEQLAFIAEMVNAGVTTYPGSYFKLTTDLDLNNIAWTPIGTETSQFGGNFDGDNHSITNLNIPSATNAGLFGVVSGGVYKNITIQGLIPASANATNAGGLIGSATASCTIDSCTNQVDIGQSNKCVGGIIGRGVNITLRNCINRGSISGTTYVGGLMGLCENTSKLPVENSVNYGSIKPLYIGGGLIGKAINVKLTKLHNNGSVSNVKSVSYTTSSSNKLINYKVGTYGNGDDLIYFDLYQYYNKINDSCMVGGICGFAKNALAVECVNTAELKVALTYPTASPTKNSCTYKRYETSVYGKFTEYEYKAYYYEFNIICLGGGLFGRYNGQINASSNFGNVSVSETHAKNTYSIDSDVSASHLRSYTGTAPNCISGWTETITSGSGGIVGQIDGTSSLDMTCNSANINKGNGMIGIASKTTTIAYSYNCGSVQNGIGAANVNVKNSYNAGATTELGISSGTVTNSYYINGSGNGTQKTDAQMKSISMPILLNADSTVFIQDIKPNVNKGYPIFKNGIRYVATNTATDISYTKATLNGNYYNCVPDSMGFEYKESSEDGYYSYKVANTQGATYSLSDLTQGTTYVARYWLSDGGIKYHGDTVQFTTLACPTKPVRSDTVKICDGEEYEFAGKILTTEGIYYDSLVATTGCDSVIELVLQVNETFKYLRYDTIRCGEQYEFYGQYLTEPGIYNEFIAITNRCNWVQLHLAVTQTLSLSVNDESMGVVVGDGQYARNTEVEISAISNEGYHFEQWSDGNTSNPRSIILDKDSSLTAIFAINKYTIIWQNDNGVVLEKDSDVIYGSTPIYTGAIPTKQADAQYTYTFAGWSPEIGAVTSDITYTAIFNTTLNKYNVIFKNGEEILQNTEIEYGIVPEYVGITPTKQGNKQYTYIFAGWTPDIVPISGDATYIAKFDSIINKYTITWKQDDSTVIDQTLVEYGQIPTHIEPTKQATIEVEYVFAGWNPDLVAVTDEATYTATYSPTLRKYTITFMDDNGSILTVNQWNYGEIPTCDEPTKQATEQYTYIFTGWTPEIGTASSDATYTAKFDSIVNNYTITWRQDDGSIIDQTIVEYGVLPVHTEPSKPTDKQYSYSFVGWTPDLVPVTGDAIYTATYDAKLPIVSIGTISQDCSQNGVNASIGEIEIDVLSTSINGKEYVDLGLPSGLLWATCNIGATDKTDVGYYYAWGEVTNREQPFTSSNYLYSSCPITLNDIRGTEYDAATIIWKSGWKMPSYDDIVELMRNTSYTTSFIDGRKVHVLTSQNGEQLIIPFDSGFWSGTANSTSYAYRGWEFDRGYASCSQRYLGFPIRPVHDNVPTCKLTLYADSCQIPNTFTCISGQEVTITAIPQDNYHFVQWSDGNKDVTRTIIVTADVSLTATFVKSRYRITWVDEDSSVLKVDSFALGTVPSYSGITPSKPSTAEYAYEFAGWSPEIIAVKEDAIYTATYKETLRKYIITWRQDDGTLIDQTSVEYGQIPAHEDPSKLSTTQYSYTFAGWTPEIVEVTGDAVYTAAFDSVVNKYTITFKNGEEVLQLTEVEYGQVPAYNGEVPTKQADAQYSYTFAGWSPEVVAVTGDATYTATYNATVNKYTITWKQDDGTTIDQTTVEYGQIPAHEDPSKLATIQYTYTFAGWTPEVVAVTGDATYTATYNAMVNKYTITWKQDDGTTIDQTTVEYGQIPAHEDPSKLATVQYTYTFAGWTPEIVEVTGDATYTAMYNATVNKYTITFKNGEEVLQSTEVEYGQIPAYYGETPTKQADAQYTYTFAGWKPKIVAVKGDETYYAVFNSTINKYTITFLNDDGSVLCSDEWEYGAMPSCDEPTKEDDEQYSYTFAGWTPEVVTVVSEAKYTATYNATPKPQGIDDVTSENAPRKVVIDNKVYIQRGDKTYTITGQEVR